MRPFDCTTVVGSATAKPVNKVNSISWVAAVLRRSAIAVKSEVLWAFMGLFFVYRKIFRIIS